METVRGEMSGVYIPLPSVMVIRCKKLERLNIEPCACFNSFISSVRLFPALAPSSCPLEQSLWDPSRLPRSEVLECLSGSPSPQLSLVSPEELAGLGPLTLVLRVRVLPCLKGPCGENRDPSFTSSFSGSFVSGLGAGVGREASTLSSASSPPGVWGWGSLRVTRTLGKD